MNAIPAPRRPAEPLLADQVNDAGQLDRGGALAAMLEHVDGQLAAVDWNRLPAAATGRIFLAIHDLHVAVTAAAAAFPAGAR